LYLLFDPLHPALQGRCALRRLLPQGWSASTGEAPARKSAWPGASA